LTKNVGKNVNRSRGSKSECIKMHKLWYGMEGKQSIIMKDREKSGGPVGVESEENWVTKV
jgi:hypothetical protein